MIQQQVKYTSVFEVNRDAYLEHQYRVIANQGSTRSSKTYSLCQLMAVIALQERKSISIVSPSLPHLKKGARKDFLEIVDHWGIYSDDHFNKTDQIYSFPTTGSYVEFFGVEEPGKVRGPGRDILYINEANLISQSTYTQLALRTKDVIFIDFNPADEFSWVYDIADKTGNKLIVSNFLNNLGNLTKEQVAEIEGLRYADQNAWKVFGLGKRGTSTETIYTHWKSCHELPGKGEIFYGQDFGYNVASALVKCELYEGSLYAQQILYETKLTTGDLIERYKSLEMPGNVEIFCDAAEPKTIEELARAGYNVKPADKDVTEGIRKVRSMPLYITEDSTDLVKEIKNYKWKVDKNGKVLDEPVKFADHACVTGDTLITTNRGFISISNIVKGDMVLTTMGLRYVVNRFHNGVKEIHSYSILLDTWFVTLRCTPDHLIKTDLGWIPISKLRSGMMVFLLNGLMDETISFSQEKGTLTTEPIRCTGMYGSTSMDLDRSDITSTILTEIQAITDPTILKLKRREIIWQSMQESELGIIPHGLKISKHKGSKPLHSGMAALLGFSGTRSMLKIIDSAASIMECPNAQFVEKSISEKPKLPSFVETTVSHSIGEIKGQTLSQGFVNAEIVSKQTNTVRSGIVRGVVVSSKSLDNVYDLEVDEAHEYFANGVLLHNCDALRYACWTKLSQPVFTVWTV